MARIGILSCAAPGHFYPASALGRRLRRRGHDVVFFQVADFAARIAGAGLAYRQLGADDFPLGSIRRWDDELGRLRGLAGVRFSIRRGIRAALMVLRDAPGAIRAERIEYLVVDQCEPAGGSVAEHLGLPCVHIALALPINLDPSVPPFFAPWAHRPGPWGRLRNRLGNGFARWLGAGFVRRLNRQRRAWGLAPIRDGNRSFSPLGQVVQLPAVLDLPGRRLPARFHHTGPWVDDAGRLPVDFPWGRLDPGRRLVYASMGTMQTGIMPTYRRIAAACAGLDVQLVISLGGGQSPAVLGDLPGDPIVVGFAPQLDLIRRASLTICHGGLNTVLESLREGVPLVVLPVTNDQPGVAARVERAGVGRWARGGRTTPDRLRAVIRAVLDEPSYRERAAAVRASIAAADGLDQAADLIEAAFGIRGPAGPTPAAARGPGIA